jgi:hypothetical protein
VLEEKSVKANRHGICHHGGSFFAVAKLTVRCCIQRVKKVTISLFYKLIYQLCKKRSPWDTTDISLWKAAGKKERRPAGQRSENCKKLLGDLGSHAGRRLLCLPEIDTYCAFRLA